MSRGAIWKSRGKEFGAKEISSRKVTVSKYDWYAWEKSRKTVWPERKSWGEVWETRLCNGQGPVQVGPCRPCFLFRSGNLLLTVVFIQNIYFEHRNDIQWFRFQKSTGCYVEKILKRKQERKQGEQEGDYCKSPDEEWWFEPERWCSMVDWWWMMVTY